MKAEYAEQLDADTEALLEKWEGSPEKFAEDIFRVRNKNTGELDPLELFYPYQPKTLHAFFYGDDSIVNIYKGRRIGISFIICVAIATEALAIDQSNHAIVSRTKGQAEERIDDIRDLLKHSKLGFDNLDKDIPTNNNGEIELPNGARIRAFSGDPESARGMDSARTVFVDEMAFLEDQKATMAAFMPFINLIEDARMMQVSTPRVSNDLFLDTNGRGNEHGHDGVIALRQPSFENPDEIDIQESLLNQDVQPVRGDMNVETVESERAQDPQGFAQEYLCRPISDEYRFFDSNSIVRSQRRGAADPTKYDPDSGTGGGKATDKKHYWHHATHQRLGGMMVMGVDIGASGPDDTAISVFEHVGDERFLRFHTKVDHNDLLAVGAGSDPSNPSNIGDYVAAVTKNMGIDKVFLDMTGPGEGFQSEVQARIGKKAQGFNFSDKDEVERMMGDFNFGLHNNLVHLVPDKAIQGQLEAIVKEQNHESSKPKFSGKDHAPNNKDDLAMALVLGAYPPNFDADRSTNLHQRDRDSSGYNDSTEGGNTEPEEMTHRTVTHRTGGSRTSTGGSRGRTGGSRKIARSTEKKSYSSRHPRRSSR